ncbi:MAG TPA: hypothetical protein VHB79_26175 [Polyangiaceae bacterium]|nr:hypothetical protein [Polyangiaceae bacterium]
MADKPGQTQAFYRFEDAQGRVHIVSSLDDVPVTERAKVRRVDLNSADAVSRYPAATPGFSMPSVDGPSFALGFGAALLVGMLLRIVPGGGRWLWKLALIAGIVLVLTGAYLGAVRRAAGIDGGALAAPSALIQDAKTAVEHMNQRQKQQEEELRKLQAEGR